MDKHVLAAAVRLNKSIALRRIEPLHCTCRHVRSPQSILKHAMLVTEIRQKKGPASVNRRASVVRVGSGAFVASIIELWSGAWHAPTSKAPLKSRSYFVNWLPLSGRHRQFHNFVNCRHYLIRRRLMNHMAVLSKAVKGALRNVGMQPDRLLDVDQPVVFARDYDHRHLQRRIFVIEMEGVRDHERRLGG